MKKEEAIEKLKRRQSFIDELQGESYESLKFNKWQRDTGVTIKKIFGKNDEPYLRFINILYHREPTWAEAGRGVSHAGQYGKGLEEARTLLQSFIEEVEEYWEDEATTPEEKQGKEYLLGSDVFIVHGHDEAVKETVARFIEKLGLKAIVLHEQPDQGRTIIEKIEDYSNVGFAIVLFTPDDMDKSVDGSDETDSRPRARQNVILELGFFLGKLGRNRVCALYKGSVEIPSDYNGVLYIPMEQDWRLRLAKEIKAAGIEVNLNKAI